VVLREDDFYAGAGEGTAADQEAGIGMLDREGGRRHRSLGRRAIRAAADPEPTGRSGAAVARVLRLYERERIPRHRPVGQRAVLEVEIQRASIDRRGDPVGDDVRFVGDIETSLHAGGAMAWHRAVVRVALADSERDVRRGSLVEDLGRFERVLLE